MLVDEADLDVIVGGGGGTSPSSSLNSSSNRHNKKYDSSPNHSKSPTAIHGNAPKRKAGPLPRDFRYRRSRRRRDSADDSSSIDAPLSIDEDNSSVSDISDVESIASDVSMIDADLSIIDPITDFRSDISAPSTSTLVGNVNDVVADDDERPSTSTTMDDVPPTNAVAKRPRIEKTLSSERFDPKLLPDLKKSLARLIRQPGKGEIFLIKRTFKEVFEKLLVFFFRLPSDFSNNRRLFAITVNKKFFIKLFIRRSVAFETNDVVRKIENHYK